MYFFTNFLVGAPMYFFLSMIIMLFTFVFNVAGVVADYSKDIFEQEGDAF